MSNINRYDITSNSHIEDLDIDENKSGRWVDFRDHRDLIKSLERQLEEARELVFTAYQEGWNDNRNNLDCWETHWIDSDSRYSLEQLKEKGDE